MTTTQRGRPRKAAERRLDERVLTRLTEKDKRLLQEIAEHKGLAPETLVRVWVLPALRSEHHNLFGEDRP